MNHHSNESLPQSYFEAMYRHNPDPWDFATSPYEAAKYAATVAALPRTEYQAGLEIGCSIGVLTEQLAARCRTLLALDVAEQALVQAQQRCQHLPHVQFMHGRVPDDFPAMNFDLIVLSEVGYYLSHPDLKRLQTLMLHHLVAEGHLILAHWTPFVADYPLTGDDVHASFLDLSPTNLQHLYGTRAEHYRLDVFARRGTVS